jgi:glycine dehydrogenase
MLLELGFKDLDSFISSVVPQNIHIKGEIEKIFQLVSLK